MAGTVLICAATARELEAARGLASGNRILCVTGVGIPLTLSRLARLIADRKPAVIVDIGIAGAYPGAGLAIGDVVTGESEVFGDMGLELPGAEAFAPLGGLPWADEVYRHPLRLAAAPFPALQRAGQAGKVKAGKGCTVNACTGTRATGELRRRLFGADFESMEGAAAALAGALEGIPVAEIRAISNFAADRDMRPGNVDLALESLRACLDACGEGLA